MAIITRSRAQNNLEVPLNQNPHLRRPETPSFAASSPPATSTRIYYPETQLENLESAMRPRGGYVDSQNRNKSVAGKDALPNDKRSISQVVNLDITAQNDPSFLQGIDSLKHTTHQLQLSHGQQQPQHLESQHLSSFSSSFSLPSTSTFTPSTLLYAPAILFILSLLIHYLFIKHDTNDTNSSTRNRRKSQSESAYHLDEKKNKNSKSKSKSKSKKTQEESWETYQLGIYDHYTDEEANIGLENVAERDIIVVVVVVDELIMEG
jgi:hypothetical protein